jgi:glyoxylase-like metal-dependent hydrolase (beta-lactamase superfamily II)
MKVTKKGQLYQLTFLPTVFPVNSYLVEEENELTLVDTALPNSYKEILNVAQHIQKPITRIVLTHAHGDHIGSLDRLKELLPDVKACISARDAKLLRGDVSLEEGEPQTRIRGGVPKPGSIRTTPDVLLQEGDCMGSLVVYGSPGHTPGSISLLDTRTRMLIVGDAFATRGGIVVSGVMNWKFPFPAMATWNKAKAIESAKKLLALEPTLLATGHGQMIDNPCELMKGAIEKAERK